MRLDARSADTLNNVCTSAREASHHDLSRSCLLYLDGALCLAFLDFPWAYTRRVLHRYLPLNADWTRVGFLLDFCWASTGPRRCPLLDPDATSTGRGLPTLRESKGSVFELSCARVPTDNTYRGDLEGGDKRTHRADVPSALTQRTRRA